MNPLELISLVGFGVVLVLLLWRPQLGIAAFVMYYPLNDHVPRLPIPGFNAESLLFGIMGAVTRGCRCARRRTRPRGTWSR